MHNLFIYVYILVNPNMCKPLGTYCQKKKSHFLCSVNTKRIVYVNKFMLAIGVHMLLAVLGCNMLSVHVQIYMM